MTIDLNVSWMIALAICTLYGWYQYSRGFNEGGSNATGILVQAIVESKKMSLKEIQAATEALYYKQHPEERDNNEDS